MITASAADAEEAAQDGFVKALGAIRRFRRGEPFRPWLLRIVANEARNRRRSAGRRAHLTLRAGAERSSGDAAPSPEDSVVSGERSAELLAAVNRLPEAQKLVIACRYLLQLSDEETAVALGVRRGTVKSRSARALARLREELGANDGELERELRGLELDWPPEPNVVSAVCRRLRERHGFLRRRPLLVAAAVLVVALAAVFVVPSARTAILRWLGLGQVRIVRVERLPRTSRLAASDLGLKTLPRASRYPGVRRRTWTNPWPPATRSFGNAAG